MNYLWGFMILVGVLYGAINGTLPEVTEAAVNSAKEAVALAITMTGVMAFWMGMMKIAECSGIVKAAVKKMRPVLTFLFPDIPDDHPANHYIAVNMIANMLGLGWAATPAGLKAMQQLQELHIARLKAAGKNIQKYSGNATKEMCTFLIINISSATDSHEHCGVPQSVWLGASGCGGGTGTCSDHYQHSNGSHFLPDCKSKENGLMYTIGIIEQDKALGDAMEQVLDEKGYFTVRADSLTDAGELFQQVIVDMVVLDLEQKEFAGKEDVAAIWENTFLALVQAKPLLLIRPEKTGSVFERCKKCIERADDYIRKPFDMQEFRIRVEVRLSKIPAEKEKVRFFYYEEIKLDIEKRLATIGGQTTKLTRTEAAILKCLIQRNGRTVTKTTLLDEIAEDTPDCVENSIKVHASNLRRKLRELSGRDYIETRKGVGLRLRKQ